MIRAILLGCGLVAVINSPVFAQSHTPKIRECQSMRATMMDTIPYRDQKYRSKGCWHRVEAANGAAYEIDLGLIQVVGGIATTAVYADEGGAFEITNLRRWHFTCTGHVSSGPIRSIDSFVYAPPNSVGRKISDVVCEGLQVRGQ